MLTRTLTRLIMGVALLCGTIAWSGWAYLNTAAAPHRVEDVADAVIADPEARFEIAGPLADQIVDAAGVDPSYTPRIRDAVATAIADPRVSANVTAAFGSLHARAVGVPDDRPATIDAAALIAAVREHLSVVDPALAALIPDNAVGDLHLPNVHPPFVASLRRVAVLCTGWLALIALAGLAVALIIGDRTYALRRFGIWAIVTGAVWAIGPRVLILAAHQWAPEADATLDAAISAATKMVAIAATVLVAAGIGALIAAPFAGMRLIPESISAPPEPRPVRRAAPRRPTPPVPEYATWQRGPAPPPVTYGRPLADHTPIAGQPRSPVAPVTPAVTTVMRPAGWGVGQFTAPVAPAPRRPDAITRDAITEDEIADDEIDPWAYFAAPAVPSSEPLDDPSPWRPPPPSRP